MPNYRLLLFSVIFNILTCVTVNMIGSFVYIFTNLLAVSDGVFEPRIVGGQFAKITDFPHSAFLAIKCDYNLELDSSFSWVCGASILNQQILLTAAHCLAECTANSWILVSVGNVNMFKGYRTSAVSFLIHEDFDPETESNDIALMKLNRSIPLNANMSRVVLLKNPPYAEKAQTAGWGMTDEDTGLMGPYLKQVDQYVWKHLDCMNFLKETIEGVICASSDKKGDYVASGDSGSALIVRGYIQIGIVSFKNPTVDTGVTIYTNVAYFLSWIERNAETIFCDRY